jgi:hemoglobin/transferrin/lactoferrin receptor protein
MTHFPHEQGFFDFFQINPLIFRSPFSFNLATADLSYKKMTQAVFFKTHHVGIFLFMNSSIVKKGIHSLTSLVLMNAGISLCSAADPQPSTATPPTESMSEVIVQGSPGLNDRQPHQVPATIMIKTREELQQEQTRTIPESLKGIPGVAVQKTAHGHGSPIIRGFTGYRTLSSIDGIRYNNSIFRDGPNEYYSLIDPLMVDQIEVVQGPGSIFYGSDAVGGAINLLSRGADLNSAKPGETFARGQLSGRGHTSEKSWLSRAEVDFGQGESWGFHLGGSWKDFGDFRSGDGAINPYTGYQQYSYDGRFDWALDKNWRLTLAHQQLWQDDVERTHSTIYGRSFAGTLVGTDLRRVTDYQRTLSYLQLRGRDLESWITDAQLTLSYQTLDEDFFRHRGNGRQEYSTLDLDTYGAALQLTSRPFGGILTWGADYYRDEADSARLDISATGEKTQRIQGLVGDDSRYDLFGFYAEHEQPTFDGGPTIQLGGRYTYAKADIGRYEDPLTERAASQSDDWSAVVGALRLVQPLDAKKETNAYASLSQSFRAPNLSDLSRLDAARSSEIETAQTDLDPEKFTHYELGFKHQSSDWQWHLAGYYTDITDLITSTPTGRIIDGQREVTKENSSEGHVVGALGEVRWNFATGWQIGAGLSWSEGEVDLDDGTTRRRQPLSRVPPVTAFYHLQYTGADERWWVQFGGETADRADRLNSSDLLDNQRIPLGGTPGYTVLHLRGGWVINDHCTVQIGLENLLDENYRVHGSGSNEPGFGLMAGLKLSF